jgi:SAM-dependent methyltransferase
MSDPCIRRETCRLCGERELELVLPVAVTPPGDHYVSADHLSEKQACYPHDIVLCRRCGHAQLAYTVNPDILYGRYVYVSSISLGLVEHFRGYAGDVLARIKPAAGSLAVDIGSNDGSLLRAFKERGMRVLGVDPAEEIAAKATESGIETWAGYFTKEMAGKVRNERGAAVIVTANNVTANVDNLSEFVEGIRNLLAPDGVFVFETSYLLDVIEKMLIETVFHEHLSYFAVKPLNAFFRRLGMQLIDIQRVPTKGGSIRGTVQLASGRRAVSPSVDDLIEAETKAGLYRPEQFKVFWAKLDAVKKELQRLLRDLKGQGKTIAGYGASVGVTTLLYHFELSELLSFIADDNPRKQNTFSPGHHIPVLASSSLYEKKPDYVLILAWAYSKPIMKKHQAFAAGGGHFIIPLPTVEVV